MRMSNIFSDVCAVNGDRVLGYDPKVVHLNFFVDGDPRVTHSSLDFLNKPDCKSVKVTLDSLEVLVAEYLEEVRLGVHKKPEL